MKAATILMAALAALGPLYYRTDMEAFERVILWATPILSWTVLAFFWLGHNWARWLVLVGSFYAVVSAVYVVEWLPVEFHDIVAVENRPYNGPEVLGRSLLDWVWLGEGVLGLVLIPWLFVPRVRRYFVLSAALAAPLPVPLGAWRERQDDRDDAGNRSGP